MNQKNNAAKREERSHLLQYLKAHGILKFGDGPDLILDLGEQKIAIEHTRLFRDDTPKGSPEYHRESIEDQIVDEARMLYVADKHYDLKVDVLFNSIVPITQKKVSVLAQELRNCVRELEPTVLSGNYGPFDWNTNHFLENKIPNEINVLWIHKATYNGDSWDTSDGGAVGALQPSFIQLALDKKEEKIHSYRLKGEKVWILIVASGLKMSSYFDRDNSEFLEATYNSSADAVFLLDCSSNKVHELHI